MNWIELRHKSTFSRRLICASNFTNTDSIEFLRDGNLLYVKKDREVCVSTDGKSYFEVEGKRFERNLGNLFDRFLAPGDSVEIVWGPFRGERSFFSGRCNLIHAHELYNIINYARYTAIGVTRTRIETEGGGDDKNLMMACLAFFWMWHEDSRVNISY